jgi:hypothetical protein
MNVYNFLAVLTGAAGLLPPQSILMLMFSGASKG